jgi:hypothetical protein
MKTIFCVILLFMIAGFCKAGKLFDCNDGNSVSFVKICDGKRDCPNLADETPELCRSRTCPSHFSRCKSGACVMDTKDCEEVENIIGISDVSNLDMVVLKMDQDIVCPPISLKRYVVNCIRDKEIVPCDHDVLPGTKLFYSCE